MLLLTGISDRLKSRGFFVMIVYGIGIGASRFPFRRPASQTDSLSRARSRLGHPVRRQPDPRLEGRSPRALLCLLLPRFGRLRQHPAHHGLDLEQLALGVAARRRTRHAQLGRVRLLVLLEMREFRLRDFPHLAANASRSSPRSSSPRPRDPASSRARASTLPSKPSASSSPCA